MILSPSTSSDFESVPCRICFQPSHGNHFGSISCRACAAFFRRTVLVNNDHLKCRVGDDKCKANSNGRFICKKCRLSQCWKAGMTTEKLQHDRDLISSTERFAIDRKRKLNSFIPQTVQGFLGRPLFILACEPDLETSPRTFIDVKYLIDHAVDLFSNSESIYPEVLSSTNVLNKLSYGLEATRVSENEQMQMCNMIGKAETLIFWEYEFLTVAKWLKYCDAFQPLPRTMKIQFLKSMWYMWMRLERIAAAAEIIKNNQKTFPMTSTICVSCENFDFDISWFTKYRKEQLTYFFDPLECLFIPSIVEPLIKLRPSTQEMTYMLCLLSFQYAGKNNGGDIQKLADSLLENLANDLHTYYLNELNLVNYAGRMAKMMQIVQLVEKDMYERMERMQIAKIFDIFMIDFSHPEMFFNNKR